MNKKFRRVTAFFLCSLMSLSTVFADVSKYEINASDPGDKYDLASGVDHYDLYKMPYSSTNTKIATFTKEEDIVISEAGLYYIDVY